MLAVSETVPYRMQPERRKSHHLTTFFHTDRRFQLRKFQKIPKIGQITYGSLFA